MNATPASAMSRRSPPLKDPLYSIRKGRHGVGSMWGRKNLRVRVANEDSTLTPPVTRLMNIRLFLAMFAGYKGVEFYNDREGTFFSFKHILDPDPDCLHYKVGKDRTKRVTTIRSSVRH